MMHTKEDLLNIIKANSVRFVPNQNTYHIVNAADTTLMTIRNNYTANDVVIQMRGVTGGLNIPKGQDIIDVVMAAHGKYLDGLADYQQHINLIQMGMQKTR